MASMALTKAVDWIIGNTEEFRSDFEGTIKRFSDLSAEDIDLLKKIFEKGVAWWDDTQGDVVGQRSYGWADQG